jgi:hypothetical protein
MSCGIIERTRSACADAARIAEIIDAITAVLGRGDSTGVAAGQ